MIRTIIIDDEPSAVDVLSLLLKKKCGNYISVLAVSNSSQEGRSLIELHRPDLVFLKAEMPGLTSKDVVMSFGIPSFRVILVTSYQTTVTDASPVSTINYLHKPVDADKVVRVVEKVRNAISRYQPSFQLQIQSLFSLIQSHVPADRKIGIAMAGKILFVRISEIVYCEASGAYTSVYLYSGKKIVASKALGDFELQLSSFRFFRIHHSTLINLSHIREFQRYDGGCVIMDNDSKLEVSQRRRKDFLDAIGDLLI